MSTVRTNIIRALDPSAGVLFPVAPLLAGGTAMTVQSGMIKVDGYTIGTVLVGGDPDGDYNQAFGDRLDWVKTHGGVFVMGPGTYHIASGQQTDLAAKPWALTGAGRESTSIILADGAGTGLVGTDGSAVGYTISDLLLDCQYSVHGTGNHGISIADTSGVRLLRLKIRDFKNCPAIVWATVPYTYSDVWFVDIHADGLGAASNGLLHVNIDWSGMHQCHVRGLSKDPLINSPGYALQSKGKCRYWSLTASSADNCTAGFAFGNDDGLLGVQHATVSGVRVRDCVTAFEGSYCEDNEISNVFVDMTSTNAGTYPGEQAFNIGAGGKRNTFTGIHVNNVRSSRSAFRFRAGAEDNAVDSLTLNNINITGVAALFDATDGTNAAATRNHVRIIRAANPTVRSGGVGSFFLFGDSAAGNSGEYTGHIVDEVVTLSGDVVSISNPCVDHVLIETEGLASTDSCTAIVAPWVEDGKIISVRTASNLRTVTFVHSTNTGTGSNTSNLKLGGSDRVSNSTQDTMTLRWNANRQYWTLISYMDNA